MKTQSYLFGILVILFALIAICGAGYLAFTQKPKALAVVPPPETTAVTQPASPTPPPPIVTMHSTTSVATLPTLSSPLPNSKVESPLTVLGSAVGNWYFEASFPVILKDGSGNILAEAPAKAQGDWMTTSTVPYLTTLTWATTTATSGVLILKKDNPSGMPENDAEISFPVLF